MSIFHVYFARRRIWTIWFISAVLLMKGAIPIGYMPVISNGSLAIVLCSGFGPEKMAAAMPEMANHHGKLRSNDGNEMPCGFTGHAPASLTEADPILLLVAIAFVVATIFRMPIPRSTRRASYSRPHLRGPPAGSPSS